MKIYFTASLHNIDIDKSVYEKIVFTLEDMGYEVISDHILKQTTKNLDKQSAEQRSMYYKKMSRRIAASDVMVCEVSFPSTVNIGHEVSLALDRDRPIVALYKPGREPGILQGITSEKFNLLEYTKDNLKEVLEYGLEEAAEQVDVRFNFFVSPKIANYLDNVAKSKKIPRAVYLRRLIEEDMSQNEEYPG